MSFKKTNVHWICTTAVPCRCMVDCDQKQSVTSLIMKLQWNTHNHIHRGSAGPSPPVLDQKPSIAR